MVLTVTLLLRLAICIAIGGNSIHKKRAAIKQQRLIREKNLLIFAAPSFVLEGAFAFVAGNSILRLPSLPLS